MYEELWNYGFPQEMEHFARCVRGMEEPQATGRDGRVVQELLYAGYQSAGSSRRVKLPFDASGWPSPSTFGGRPTTCECEQPQIPGEGLKSRCRSRA